MRKQLILLLAGIMFVAGIAGCQPSVEASQQALFDTFEALDASVRDNDLDAFVSHYAEGAYHLPPGAPRNSTRAEIAEFLEGTLGLYDLVGEPQIHFADDASMAFLYGEYEVPDSEAQGGEVFRGRFISVWKKGVDGWKCVVDVWNTEDPRFEHL